MAMLVHLMLVSAIILTFFFFNDTATTEIYTLSLHDALPILPSITGLEASAPMSPRPRTAVPLEITATRLQIGRAHVRNPDTATYRMPAFPLKKKKKT